MFDYFCTVWPLLMVYVIDDLYILNQILGSFKQFLPGVRDANMMYFQATNTSHMPQSNMLQPHLIFDISPPPPSPQVK